MMNSEKTILDQVLQQKGRSDHFRNGDDNPASIIEKREARLEEFNLGCPQIRRFANVFQGLEQIHQAETVPDALLHVGKGPIPVADDIDVAEPQLVREPLRAAGVLGMHVDRGYLFVVA